MKFLKQIQSTVATGTSPLSVASTTLNTNLNADLLDGNHASAFYLATNPSGYTTNTGTVTSVTAGSYLTGGTITGSGTLAVDATSANTASKIVVRDSNGSFSAQDIYANTFQSTNNGNGTNFKVGDDAWIGDINTANTIRITGLQDSTSGYIVFGNSNATALGRTGTGALTYGGNTVWHAGNDGASSGLDADLLDGQHGSYYAPLASPTFTGTATLAIGKATTAFVLPVGVDKFAT